MVTTRAGKHISDQEFVPVYRCRYDGPVQPDQVEVSAVRWAAEAAVVAEVKADPSKFTPWFVGARECGNAARPIFIVSPSAEPSAAWPQPIVSLCMEWGAF